MRWIAMVPVFAFLLVACEPSLPEEQEADSAPPQRQDLLTLNEAPERGTYELHWGALRVPIFKYGNPNVYGGETEVELNDLWTAMGGRLELYRGEQRMGFELVGINREPWSWNRRLWFSFPLLEEGLLEDPVVARLREAFHPGEQLQMRLRAADGAEIHPVTIRISDDYAPYRPEVDPGELPDDGGVFGFQMIQYSGRPAILRIDTSSEATRHIYDMYRKDKSYRILHVPGFRTRRRFLTEQSELFQTREIRRTELLCQEYDLLVLPEFTDYAGRQVVLSWGKMEAAPSSPNFRLPEFRRYQDAGLALRIDGQRLPLRSFTLYLSSRQNQPSRYIADDIREPVIQRALARLAPESTVYFNRLVVEDSSGAIVHFPGAFAFNIGEEPAFEWCITEIAGGKAPVEKQYEKRRERRIKLSGMSLSDIIARLLDLPPERVAVENLSSDPLLDIVFSSGKLSLPEARSLLLLKLQEAYRFTIERPGAGKLYELRVREPARWERVSQKRSIAERHFSLARRIGNEFGICVVDRTGAGGSDFRFDLELSSLEKVKKDLERAGLELLPAEGDVVVRGSLFAGDQAPANNPALPGEPAVRTNRTSSSGRRDR